IASDFRERYGRPSFARRPFLQSDNGEGVIRIVAQRPNSVAWTRYSPGVLSAQKPRMRVCALPETPVTRRKTHREASLRAGICDAKHRSPLQRTAPRLSILRSLPLGGFLMRRRLLLLS